MTTQSIKDLEELHLLGGAVISSNWTCGTGRHTACRAVPPHCVVSTVRYIDEFADWAVRGEVSAQIKRLRKKHPRALKIVYIFDLRKARDLLRQNGIVPTTYAARAKAYKDQTALTHKTDKTV